MNKHNLTKRLAELLGLKVSPVSPESIDGGLIVYPHDNEINFDPCNDWNLLMPLAIGHGVTNLHLDNNEWEVSFDFYGDIDINGTDEILSHAVECSDKQLQETIVKCLITKLENNKNG